jgi:hypothetical protein
MTRTAAFGNQWYARMWATNLIMGGLFLVHSYGFDVVEYTGFVRRQELLIVLMVLLFPVALYCWYRGDQAEG